LPDAEDDTPLHISAQHGNLEATKALVERGASLTNVNKNGNTPLILAAKYGKIEISRYLKEIGGNANTSTSNLCPCVIT
jgi:ankyrin repeat protein